MVDPQALREAVINAILHNDYSYNNPPKFEMFSDTFFRVTFRYKQAFDEPASKNTKKTRKKTTQKILEEIGKNPQISRQKLAEIVGISESGIKWRLKKMKDEGIIERVGSLKGGKWVVK